ncbi:MAG: hypothetical protein NTZ87_00625 [Candidatus Nomurabacteria bacterium]|nr:hypothetical protein [Candidatus Nomurabacteria bacterium]
MNKNRLKGIKESALLTKKFKRKLKFCFNSCFHENEALLLCWGSMAREEMGHFSDLDLILLFSNKTNNKEIRVFFDCLSKKFKNRIDLLEAYDLKTLAKIGSIDGTDRQAILLARPVCGSSKLRKNFSNLQNTFRNQTRENTREIIHTWISLFSVSKNIYTNKINNLKFGRGFLRHIIFIFLIVKLFFDKKNNIWSTQKAIPIFCKSEMTDDNINTIYLTSLNFILELRNAIQFFMQKESYYIDDILLKEMTKKYKFDIDSLKRKLRDNQSSIIFLEKDISGVISKLVSKNYGSEFQKHANLLNILIDFEKEISLDIEKTIMDTKLEILLILLAHRSKNSRTLEKLRVDNMKNWYIIHGIAINPHSNPETLLKLIKPEDKIKNHVYKLYYGFAWRNIRLYVAKNKMADKKTLNYIINHKNSRQMDRDTAKYSLASKKLIYVG